MNQRYLKNVVTDFQFAPRFLVLALLVVALIVGNNVRAGQQKALKRAESQYALVQRISEFEKALNINARPEPVVEIKAEPPPKEMVLRGMGSHDGVFKVIINSEVYGVGEMFDEFLILRITDRSVTMKNSVTNEIKTLRLPELLP